ncbi:YncE family protein [Mycobacterium hubeiense]|uniref:YncE family protein n=1 Tax=Mycobacterium hubeiense TaxID=1867256 RepID=UPI001E470801|nr:YncE family protein [Mycobacterium sp. QGD 101]
MANAALPTECAVAVECGPVGDFGVDADGGKIVVTNPADHSVLVLNRDTLAVEGSIAVPQPFAALVADDRAYVTAATEGTDGVAVLDTNTMSVIATYPLAFSITALAISPDGKRVYAGRTGTDRVDIAVIDTTAERVGTIDIAHGPGISADAVRVDPLGRRLYVATTDARGSQLVIVDIETAQVEGSVWIGSPIRDLALGADATAYVLSSDRAHGGIVDVVDLAAKRITDTVTLGGAPTQLVLSTDGARVYVVDYDRVVVLCALTNELLETVQVGARPSCVAATRDRLYVADYSGGISVFSVSTESPMLYSQFLATDPIAVPELVTSA